MKAKFFSMDIDTMAVVVRIFLPDKESLLESGHISKHRQLEVEGKITIPRKDI